ncbi:MAG: hypothetical protein RMK20_17045, partial [Verrucomicrobiales bacterium]|nr:hypothetical protein [Verrucomicrobiales bacterium]
RPSPPPLPAGEGRGEGERIVPNRACLCTRRFTLTLTVSLRGEGTTNSPCGLWRTRLGKPMNLIAPPWLSRFNHTSVLIGFEPRPSG